MPYKHIAAHLKKTELACRLHYHQLSHGSNRRKRTTSMSSSSSSTGHSPIMSANIPSPIHESPSRSVSPPGSLGGYGSSGGVQLPSIMNASVTSHNSPRLPAILPKPANMSLALSSSRYSSLQEHAQHSAPLLPSASFSAAAHSQPSNTSHAASAMGSLRLDCSSLPSSSAGPQSAVDMGRLHAVYNTHRSNFWSAIASEYGQGAHPSVLEQAWRTGNPVVHPANANGYRAQTPITPVGSPDERDIYSKHDKTRISAILGIDANPRSPKERELVRRMEEERVMVGVGA